MAIRLPAGPPMTPTHATSADCPGPEGPGQSQLARDNNLPSEIAVSWWRSELLGVRPELAIESLASEPLLDADERLRRAVQPVLDELVTRLAGTNSAVVLGDHRAVILDRRGTTATVNAEMDRVGIFPGYAFAEWSVGTNAIGTAAEERRLVRVAGTEHYAEVFKHLSCYGVPLVHPLNRRLVGILDLTFPARDEHPLMRSFMHDAGQRIEGLLAEWASLRERAQFECFLSLGRRSRRPVLSTMDEAVLLNRSARDLHPVDQAALIAAAGEIGDAEHGAMLTLPVHDHGEPVSVRVHTHSDLARFPGVILEVLPPTARRRPTRREDDGSLPGLAGASKAWTAFCAAARRAADAGTSVAIAGETGSGRLAVARALHDLARRAHFTVVDAASAMADGRPEWLRRLREQLADAETTVVVRHLERCDDALAAAAAAEIDAAPGAAARLVGTVEPAMLSDAVRPLLDRFCVRLAVPPLRDRRDDTELLVRSFLERHGAGSKLRFHPQAIAVLRAADFPGNVRGLEAVVAGIARTRRSGDVLAGDLPELRPAGPAHLTPMERAERDAIVKALHEAKQNKAAAAAALGISRPTLYRKLSIYGIGD